MGSLYYSRYRWTPVHGEEYSQQGIRGLSTTVVGYEQDSR
jgi:hypothetical protein